MYDDLESFIRLLSKKGFDYVIQFLSSDLPVSVKDALSKNHILVNGYPNLTLISSLV